jgi:DNA-binding IclR family transcriptional regulator
MSARLRVSCGPIIKAMNAKAASRGSAASERTADERVVKVVEALRSGNGGELPVARKLVKPVRNAIQILRYLSDAKSSVRAVQVARQLSINNSTCFNILRTLVAEGLVDFDSAGKTYSIGLGMVRMLRNTLIGRQDFSAIRPILRDLAAKYNATATLWRRLGSDRIVLLDVEHDHGPVRIHMSEGQHLPMLLGASGRLVAAFGGLSKSEVRAAYSRARWDQDLSFDTYWQQVQEAAQRGWAVDDGYFSRGVLIVAVPILDAEDSFLYSLSMVMFRGQYNAAAIARIGADLVRVASQVSKALSQ